MSFRIHNARLVMPDRILNPGCILVEDGRIRSINGHAPPGTRSYDLNRQFLLPGLVDMHCDALERTVEPRPNVLFPLDFAFAQADRHAAAAGITTAYHSLAFAEEELGVRNAGMAAEMVRRVSALRHRSLVETKIHCRYELTDETSLKPVLSLIREGRVDLVSFMDHTPGQGQFKSLEAYVSYYSKRYNLPVDETSARAHRKAGEQERAMGRLRRLAGAARSAGIKVASHDDDSPARVSMMASIGAGISEFPITMESAAAARQQGLFTVLGAPNVLRGQSQSQSMRAVDGIAAGVVDGLCSDYFPGSLLAAIFRIVELKILTLPEAVRLLTLNPCQALGLHDRGELKVGKRADLMAVAMVEHQPQVAAVWSAGKLAYFADCQRTGCQISG